MIIDRDKHNKYVAGWKPNYTVPTNQGSSSGTNVTIVYGGGGSGSSTPVSSEAFSYYKVSDGENVITQEAKVQKDIANLSIIGDEGIKVELITDPTIFEASFTSTGINEGVYKISYGKVTTVVEQPTEPETQAEEPTEPEVVITFPMTITYVSGEKIKAEQFDTLRLLNDTEEVATYPSSGLAIEGDADGILSISLEVYKEVQSVDEEGKPVQDAEGNPVMEKQGLYFNRILLTSQLEDQPSTQAEGDSTEEEPQQPTYESLLSFDVVVNIDTVIKLSSDSVAGLWKLDDNGNIYTEYNAYSLKELSAYGPGEGEAGEGVGFLHELGDVSIPAPNEIPDNAILQYNIETDKWEAVEWSELDDTATREWVEQKFKNLINGAPADLDTLGEIAIVIQELQQLLDWFSFVDGRIRANYDFWGVGEISAYGLASGSDPGTGGAGYLHELGDVTINNDTLTDGQIIVWDEDSQMWVNVDFSGLDEGALALYLTQNKYATQGWVNSQLDPINNKLEEFQTTIDMINDMFEWDNGKIKAKATLYSVGEISAYGAGEGSSGIIGYLHELEDVLLTDLQDDQLLMYDATIGKWINVDKNSVGLNETELEQYLTTHKYVTSNQVVLPTRRIIAGTGLTGGGALSSDVTLSLATSGVTSGVYTKVTVDQYGRVTLGALLAENDIPNIAWSKIHSTPTTLAGYGITDAYTMQQSDERYVNVTGDIMTGNLILPTLQANTSIILGSVKLEYDSANNALKISNVNTQQVINLYATGEISAYGYNDGSSSTGGYLHELEDVTLSNPQNGQALVYNSSTGQWVNTTIQAGGIDEAALADYLTSNQYATQQWVTSQNYLTAVSVDTISDLHSSWDAVLKAQKPAWLTTVSLATISDLHASWDALLKAAPTDYVTRWPGVSEVTGLQDVLNLKLDAATFNDLFEKVEISTGVYAIRAKYGLYSNDWISAKGANPDAGGVVSGATDLDGLSDVTLTNMQNGQVLMYNGSQWVNSTLDVGLDETALAQYLTSHLYATQSWVNSQNYATEADLDARIDALVNGAPAAFDTLKEIADVLQGNVDSIGDILTALGNKADKTITITAGTGLTGGGNLSANRTLSLATVGTAGTYTKVTVDAYGRVTGHASLAATDIPNLPWSKITSGKPTTLGGYGITDGVNVVSVTGSGNAVTTANVSGHTLTLTKGSTFLLSSAYTAADVLAKLKTVDGSGSGLDADTLDGLQASSFQRAVSEHLETELSGGGRGKFVILLHPDTLSDTANNLPDGYSVQGTFYLYRNIGNCTASIIVNSGAGYSAGWSNGSMIVVSGIHYYNIKFVTCAYGGKLYKAIYLEANQDLVQLDFRGVVHNKDANFGKAVQFYSSASSAVTNTEVNGSLKDFTKSNRVFIPHGTESPSVKIGNGTISWDATNNCFHFSHGLYSDSFVSAKGANSGSGGTGSGVTKLSDLSDVQLGTLATNQVLSWNGSKWVNKAISTGLDETALAQYLTDNGYATQGWAIAQFAYKTGTNAAGTWPISITSEAGWLDSHDTRNVNNTPGQFQAGARFEFKHNSTDGLNDGITYHGILHFKPYGSTTDFSGGPSHQLGFTHNGNLWMRTSTSSTAWGSWRKILDTTNYTSTLDTRYVKKAGDTMTGTLTVPSLVVSSSTATVSGNKVWHAGNDGSGSGLDADLLDGLQYTSFESYRVVQINASSLNQNTWYPVTMSIGNSVQTRIRIEGNTSANASWNPRADKYMALILDYTVNGSMWGWTSAQRVIYQYMEGSGTASCLRGLGQLTNSSTEYVFVRGGAVYNFYVSRFITPVLRTSTYTVSEQSVSPTTTAPAAISRTNALITDNVYSATQLQTARTINGTAFNGTSNIVTSYWGTARTLSLTGNATGSVSMNGSSNVSMSVNVNYATSAGNASTLGGTSKAGLFTALSSSNATNLSVTIGGTTKSITDLYANYAVSAGNADTLDGVHNGSVTALYLNIGSVSDFNTLNRNGLFGWSTSTANRPYSYGTVLQFSNVNNPVPGTNGHWVNQIAYATDNHLIYTRNRINKNAWSAWETIAYLSSNVASATKLQTARTIWGQPFNGTAPVSGNMTGVGSISASGNITTDNALFQIDATNISGDRGLNVLYNGQKLFCGFGSSGTNGLFITHSGLSPGWVLSVPSSTVIAIAQNSGINVGIGTTSPSYKLHVTGTGYFSGALTTASTITASGNITGSNIISTTNHIYFGDSSYTNGRLTYESNTLYIQTSSSGNMNLCGRNGATMPTLTINATTTHCEGGIYSDSYVSAKGNNSSSDIRLKNILSLVRPSLKDFAKAPLFKFAWKSNPDMVEIGSSAQYWKNVLPDTVKERDGWLEMGYGNIALAGVITIARDFETLEQRVDRLEKENGKLRKRIKELERRTT